jgi:hypothetical protein
MARFNPQAFLAGMQSLIAPQQQADQQVAQMRMQQMDRTRENENTVNQRMQQGQQMRIQQDEATRAGERFSLERAAAERQKLIDERNTTAFDLAQGEKRTGAVKELRNPITEKQTLYDAALSKYNTALQNPNLISRADWNKITSELTSAGSALNNAYNSAKGFLPFMAPQLKLDETAIGSLPTIVVPTTREEAIRKYRSGKPVDTVTATEPVKKTDAGVTGTGVDLPPPPPVNTAAGIDLLGMIAPGAMGAGVTTPEYLGAVAPPKTLKGKPPAVKPAPVTYTPPPPRQRIYPQPSESFLAPEDIQTVQELIKGFAIFTRGNFRGKIDDPNFNNKWHDFVTDPTVMKQFLAPIVRSYRSTHGDDVANAVFAEFETQVLEQAGPKALMPTDLVDNLVKLESGMLGLTEDKAKAKQEAIMRPLREEEIRATIAKLKAAVGGGKGGTEWKNSDKNSALRLAGAFGSTAIAVLTPFIANHKKTIDEKRALDPTTFDGLANTPGTGQYRMQKAHDDAVAARGKIIKIQTQLRRLASDPSAFYKLYQNVSITDGLRTTDVQNLLAGVDVYGGEDIGTDGGGLGDYDLNAP